jgi:hypothetical protein
LFSRLLRLQNYFFESHVLDATSWGISIYPDSDKDTSSLLCSRMQPCCQGNGKNAIGSILDSEEPKSPPLISGFLQIRNTSEGLSSYPPITLAVQAHSCWHGMSEKGIFADDGNVPGDERPKISRKLRNHLIWSGCLLSSD